MADLCNIKDIISILINKARKLVADLILCRGGKTRTSKQEVSTRIWSDLPGDMLEQVLEIIDSPEDYLNFIAVCTTWRSIVRAIEKNTGNNLPFFRSMPKKHPLPILLQQQGLDSEVHYCYSITKRKINKVHVPELSNKWIPGSWRGWLATVDNNGDGQIHLFNPITKEQIPLPPLSTIPKPISIYLKMTRPMDIKKIIVLSSEEIHAQSNCTIVALAHALHFCRIGDDKWKRIYPSILNIKDVIEFKGLLHAVDFAGTLFVIETSPSIKITPVAVHLQSRPADSQYLAESSGELLLVRKIQKDEASYVRTISFQVYRLAESQKSYKKSFYCDDHQIYLYSKELVRKVWKEIENLDERIFFVGHNRTLCLDSKLYHGCKGNCIYFADDDEGDPIRATGQRAFPHNNGVYHMDNKELEYIKNDIIDLLPMPGIWFSPNPW